MQQYAILLDGGFVRRKLGSMKEPATADSFKLLINGLGAIEPLCNMRLHRVYYYDATPLETEHQKPLGGERIRFGNSDTATRSRKLFEQLAKQPYMALRLGELAFEGWQIRPKELNDAPGKTLEISSESLKPRIMQKGVDMRIGMDIAALTLKQQVQVIVLVSGDSDFIPAMKFARREGAQLFLAPLEHHVKPAMLEHSDLLLEWSPVKRKNDVG
jgi:uncharacterized LabA/DUF88 family protein